MDEFACFDFALDESQERRAADLHAQSVVVDALFQGPVGFRVFDEGMSQELRSDWETRGDLLTSLMDGLALPVRRAIEGKLDAVRGHWGESGITCGNRQIEMAIPEVTE